MGSQHFNKQHKCRHSNSKERWNSGNVLISQADGLQIRRIISDRDKLVLADGERWEKRAPRWHPFYQIKSSGKQPSDCCLMSDWWGNCGQSNAFVCLCMICPAYLAIIEGVYQWNVHNVFVFFVGICVTFAYGLHSTPHLFQTLLPVW